MFLYARNIILLNGIVNDIYMNYLSLAQRLIMEISEDGSSYLEQYNKDNKM